MSLTGPIICIEDDDDDQQFVGAAIKALKVPHEVLFFSDGESFIEYLKNTTQKPFLILCDINLPKMHGIELRHHLNEDEYLRQKSIPFVFITTVANPALVKTAYDVTVQGYFMKPFSFEELMNQLQLIITYWRECIHPNSDF